MALTLLTGGARSGKSHLAVQMASASGAPVVFVATARPSDADMSARIARHRAARPPGWHTIEEPLDLTGALDRARGGVVVVDCLTLWVSNMMLEGIATATIAKRGAEAASAAVSRSGDTIAVTNEVGSGVHPRSDLGRDFRDLLGCVNALWAASSGRSFLVVAGRILPLQDPHGAVEGP